MIVTGVVVAMVVVMIGDQESYAEKRGYAEEEEEWQ